jgi:subtilisin-like proprotein convertase family protein
VQDIQVAVEIEHAYLGDLSINLIAPSGDSVMLQGRSLGRKTRLQAIFNLQNTPALQLFLEQSSQGEWQLQLIDAIPGDTGRLNWWKLTIGI